MAVNSWTSANTGTWEIASDWSGGIPSASDAVVIDQPGTYTVALSQMESVASVVLDDPDATLVLDSPLDAAGGFTLDAGTVTFAGGTLSAATVDLLGGLVNGGTVAIMSAGSIDVATSIDATGVVTLTAAHINVTGSVAAALVDLDTGGTSTFGTILGSGSITTDGISSGGGVTSGTATDNWIGGASGTWATAGDWSAGTPASGSDIVITQAGTYTITAAQAETVQSVVLDAPGATLFLEAPLDVADTFSMDAGALYLSNGASVLAGSFDLNGGLLEGPSVDITAADTIDLNGGSIVAYSAKLIDATGTLALPALGTVQIAGIAAPVATDVTQAVPFAQFNPVLGTLVAINAGLTAAASGAVSVTSGEQADSTVSVYLTGSASADAPSGTVLVSGPLAGTAAVASLGPSGALAVLMPTASLSVTGTVFPGAADVATFTGTGTVPLALSADAELLVTGPANMSIAASTSATATASLQYGYAPTGLGTFYSSDNGGGSTFNNPGLSALGYFGASTESQSFLFPDQTTGWNGTLSVVPFNPALGTLQAVNITVTGDINASVAAENEDSEAAAVDTQQVATVALAMPDNWQVLSAATATAAIPLGSFDGTVDYAGTSGAIDQGLTQATTATFATDDPVVLAAFLASGTVAVPISDTGTGAVTGPANLSAQLLAQGGATVTLDYTYLPAGPLSIFSVGPSPYSAVQYVGVQAVDIDQALAINDTEGTILAGATVSFAAGFVPGDTLACPGTFAGITASFNAAEGVLTLSGLSSVATYSEALADVTWSSNRSDPSIGGTDPTRSFNFTITDGTTTATTVSSLTVACFATGTRLATPDGETPVETLRPGDTVRLSNGRTRLVKWVGHRSLAVSAHARPEKVRPVRVRAGAFAPDIPARDLLLSPDHAIFTDGVLIPVRHLVNRASIRPDPAIDRVTYWHVELDAHDILLAEGLPVESYLEVGQRNDFANGGGALTLHPAFCREAAAWLWEALGAAPLVVTGPVLDRVRDRLAAREQRRRACVDRAPGRVPPPRRPGPDRP
jgi:hypothetical protein